MPESRKFLWHEIAYLLLWLGLAVALAVKGVGRPSDFALLGGQAAAFLMLRVIRKQGLWWQVRLWLPLVALNVTYFWLGDAIPRLREWRADGMLCEIDRSFFGDCLALRVMPVVSGSVQELLSAGYTFFFPLWIGGLVLAARRGGGRQLAFFTGFHLIYAIGFAGYVLFPAAGPVRYPPLASQIGPLGDGGFFTTLNNSIVRGGCNGVDVFPSLHTAITLFVLLSAFSGSRRLAAWLAVPCLLIVCATIGLQYHYAADLAAGALLGSGVWALVTYRFPLSQIHDTDFRVSSPRPDSQRSGPDGREGLASDTPSP